MSLVYNELKGSSLTVNERPRAFPAGAHEFNIDQRHVLFFLIYPYIDF